MNVGHGSGGSCVSFALGRFVAKGLAEWEADRRSSRQCGGGASALMKRVWMICWWFAPVDVPKRQAWHLEPVEVIANVKDADVIEKLVALGIDAKTARRIGTTPEVSKTAVKRSRRMLGEVR